MITKKEADKRIDRWDGDYSQIKHKRQDGFEFMETVLTYNESKEVTLRDLVNSRDPEFKSLKIGSFATRTIIADKFIHPTK